MSERIIFMFFGVILSLFFVWFTYDQMEKEQSDNRSDVKYRPIVANNLIIAMPVTMFFIQLYSHGMQYAISYIIAAIFNMFITFTFYYSLLTFALPFLRSRISARACALLWLIPNFMYNFYNLSIFFNPKFIIRVPNGFVKPLVILWTAGFVSIMLYKITGHFVFKHNILKGATICTDKVTTDIFEEEKKMAGIKFKIKLLTSPSVTTPVSISAGNRSKIFLPDKEYPEDDLHLIFRHEIIHLGRDDSGAKFFMTFCTALCWMNPLVWYAMRKSAEDAELSCDETVLLNEDQATREQYAHLILENAGDERGFSTCLSASAEAMRYRLKSITKPSKRHYGAVTVGLMFLAVYSSFGQVALAYDHSDFGTKMDAVCDVNQLEYSFIGSHYDEFARKYVCRDPDKLLNYIRGLEVSKITGDLSESEDENALMIFYNSPDGISVITLYENEIQISFLRSLDNRYNYALKNKTDWDKIWGFVDAYPAINAYRGDDEGNKIVSQLTELSVIKNGEESSIFSEEEYDAGIFGIDDINCVRFKFSDALASDYTVEIKNLDTGEITRQIIDKNEDKINLLYPSAQYKIYAEFMMPEGDIYKAVFQFTISDKA